MMAPIAAPGNEQIPCPSSAPTTAPVFVAAMMVPALVAPTIAPPAADVNVGKAGLITPPAGL